MAAFSGCPHMVFPLHVSVSESPLLIKIPVVLVPNLMASLELNYLFKKPYLKYSPFLESWELSLQHMNLVGAQFSPNPPQESCVAQNRVLEFKQHEGLTMGGKNDRN